MTLCIVAKRCLLEQKLLLTAYRKSYMKNRLIPIDWLGGVAVWRWTRDQEVAGSTPTAALFGQQPWASFSHLMCLCSPSSIIWYLARAFMLKAPYCWQRHRVQWARGYCRAVLRWSSDCIEPRYKSSALPLPFTKMSGLNLCLEVVGHANHCVTFAFEYLGNR